ncbi:2,3,4,5-tetrahydropyridine-2-carboxylate N-succinyltransferase [Streptosporangium becharense]|uniref:2,3,4,5-tetrahydropyridine-2-carboxylate N-succinyltransferase n=1 Tax=Streptosporangium becharense TaxID=1816182 RepID=A0A7W9II65_9ACTN|nr:DapH/DapD/GlmU-related protein [Streptosporangium becharense]MBB2913500.1 2,3,4,5-tetrahydropyridine-2-carboxylate N-succinyltransferase [Streptosporangium becharense]MBB5821190.1 2,3,4,5-tetrahydropyridine-2-carboxylate N-succinyltransferase [Streptosporangium becharense]
MTGTDAGSLPAALDDLWHRRRELSPADTAARGVVVNAIDMLDSGRVRVAEISAAGEVVVNARARRAVLLAFRVLGMARSQVGDFHHHDRVPLKTSVDGVRVVPGAIARWGAHLAPGVVLMPSFVDIGAHVGTGSMVGTWVSVGSCAQIGGNVRLAAGVTVGGVDHLDDPDAPDDLDGLGGVDDPARPGPSASPGSPGSPDAGSPDMGPADMGPADTVPAVVEDDALIGDRAVVAAGARVGRGAVVAAGTILSGVTPVVDARTGEELAPGRIPDWCVATGGSRHRDLPGGAFDLPCVVVLDRLEPGRRPGRAELGGILHGGRR